MQEIADVYARSLFEVAQEHDALDEIKEELDSFADSLRDNQELRMYFFSPYFSTGEKKDGLHRVLDGADEHFVRFLEVLAENNRLPLVSRVRSRFDDLWAEERRLINAEVTSAVELDEDVVKEIGERIEEETGHRVELSTRVDPEVIGGLVIRVGNMVMDASVRNKLDRLREQVVAGA
jgi:F-type H+-transporting ATPase subunit delta